MRKKGERKHRGQSIRPDLYMLFSPLLATWHLCSFLSPIGTGQASTGYSRLGFMQTSHKPKARTLFIASRVKDDYRTGAQSGMNNDSERKECDRSQPQMGYHLTAPGSRSSAERGSGMTVVLWGSDGFPHWSPRGV